MRVVPVQVAFSLLNKESIQCVEKILNSKSSDLIIKRRAEQTYGRFTD